MSKRFSQACENNKGVILQKLAEVFANVGSVLEVGSGTGQHAVFFAERLPHVYWQTADLDINHDSIHAWLEEAALPNIGLPLTLDVAQPWPVREVPAVFTANTLHIMPWQAVEAFFVGLEEHLVNSGVCVIYGPFNRGGRFTSASNAAFNQHLKSQSPLMGIRDLEAIIELANSVGLVLKEDWAMPANNAMLVFHKVA